MWRVRTYRTAKLLNADFARDGCGQAIFAILGKTLKRKVSRFATAEALPGKKCEPGIHK
jgi:hypothetical protein